MDKLNVEADYRFDEIKNKYSAGCRQIQRAGFSDKLFRFIQIKAAETSLLKFSQMRFSPILSRVLDGVGKIFRIFHYVAEKNRELNDSFSSFRIRAENRARHVYCELVGCAYSDFRRIEKRKSHFRIFGRDFRIVLFRRRPKLTVATARMRWKNIPDRRKRNRLSDPGFLETAFCWRLFRRFRAAGFP